MAPAIVPMQIIGIWRRWKSRQSTPPPSEAPPPRRIQSTGTRPRGRPIWNEYWRRTIQPRSSIGKRTTVTNRETIVTTHMSRTTTNVSCTRPDITSIIGRRRWGKGWEPTKLVWFYYSYVEIFCNNLKNCGFISKRLNDEFFYSRVF